MSYDDNDNIDDLDEYVEDDNAEFSTSKTPEEAISKAMDNFSPREANYAISIKMIPIMAFMNKWEERLSDWVGIPQGMNRPLLPDSYFTFFTDVFDKAIRYSASRKGKGREQLMEVLRGYFGSQQVQQGFIAQVKEKLTGAKDSISSQ